MDKRAEKAKRKIVGAAEIIQNDEIHPAGANKYVIKSKLKKKKKNKEYTVVWTDHGWACDCHQHTHGNTKCKHICAIEIMLYAVEAASDVIELNPIQMGCACTKCGSDSIVKDGKRKNKVEVVQKYKCRDCGNGFSDRGAFARMRFTGRIITAALQLYFSAESMRGVQQYLAQEGINVSHVTIYRWIKKYTGMIHEYVKTIVPNLGMKWHADELWLKIDGKLKYLFAVMDADTRFWIEFDVADSKFTHDVRKLFRKSKETAGKIPGQLTTDGLRSYGVGFKKEFLTAKGPRARHVKEIHLQDQLANNNVQERLNGEIRDREKTFRGLKRKDTPIIFGLRIFHNYIRPHMGLDGDTPADRAGIKINGCNKWLTLIQNAYASSSLRCTRPVA